MYSLSLSLSLFLSFFLSFFLSLSVRVSPMIMNILAPVRMGIRPPVNRVDSVLLELPYEGSCISIPLLCCSTLYD